ncbi:ERF family protein [Sphingomonas soli]|uniref:ERF family protein n=1 Tax=Sphingomonas soli TaxID=266127 RepID=UPI000A05DA09|nr:ERF family protein [Sphingomonas soli]
MTALATMETSGSAVADYSGGLLDVIARAARDPNVDIDKMERLIAMQERVQDRSARASYFAALSVMQPGLPVVSERGGIKDRNGNVQSTYALWEDVNEAIRPILAEHGFALTFRVRRADAEISVTGVLSHRDGHFEETELTLPTDASGSKNAVQAVGSSTSYGKRYTAFALLNITTTGEDDDGRRGGDPTPVSLEQLDELQRRASEVGADLRRFCAHLKVHSLAVLPASRYGEALRKLDLKAAAK